MSTRTPSDLIDRLAIPWRTKLSTRSSLATLALCVVLAGCSSGAARDAARDEARDAGLDDQLAAQQATRIVQKYFPPTGTPSPTEPPAPALGQVALTFGFRQDGTPDGSYASVPAGAGTVYVSDQTDGSICRTKGACGVPTPGATRWQRRRQSSTPARPIAGSRFRSVSRLKSLPGGIWRLYLADERALGSLAFGVTGMGTSSCGFPPSAGES